MRTRVGHINFLNCYPLYYGLSKNMSLDDMELKLGTPAELNRYLFEGKLDISPISSIEYCRHQKKYLMLPDPTVSSNGQVKSVILFSKVPIDQLDKETIALTNTSSTSHVLLKIILKERYGINANYLSCEPDLKSMLKEHKAALLIGDNALSETVNNSDLYCYDLGEEWEKLSGKKMVYAVWCVRRDYVKKNSGAVRKILSALTESSGDIKDNLDEIISNASTYSDLERSFIESYFSCLDFNFDKSAREGLLMFSEMAKRSGCINKNSKLEFFE